MHFLSATKIQWNSQLAESVPLLFEDRSFKTKFINKVCNREVKGHLRSICTEASFKYFTFTGGKKNKNAVIPNYHILG